MILIDRIPTLRGGLLVLSVCFLAACSFDSSIHSRGYINATPRYICPCETVTVDWSCPKSGEDTFYCDRFSVRATHDAADPSVGPREKSGRRELPMVCFTTGLTMDIEYEGRTENFGTTINVINEGSPLMIEYDLQPSCRGAVLVWESLPLKDLNSPCVGITNFCNNYGSTINVTPDGDEPVSVPPGCSPLFNGPSRNLVIAPETIPFIPGGFCGAERSTGLPGPISISVTRECNRELEFCDL